MLRSALEAALALVASLALGALLELLASRALLGLHLVPLGPSGGADPAAALAPFGEHGWLPVPLGVLDLALLWNATPTWMPHSWWDSCRGAFWGQLRTLTALCLTILPSVLAAWLAWMPWRCTPLPCVLAGLVAGLSCAAALFWLDALPLLPRARVTDACAAAGLRRATLCLLHACYFGVGVLLGGGPTEGGSTAAPADECAALAARVLSEPAAVIDLLGTEMVAQTPQVRKPAVVGAHVSRTLVVHMRMRVVHMRVVHTCVARAAPSRVRATTVSPPLPTSATCSPRVRDRWHMCMYMYGRGR